MNRELLRLAVPNIISNISVPLISTVDTVLMGNLSHLHLGAMGLGTIIFQFLYWNFGFLRMGTTGMVAQALGKEDTDAQINLLKQALLLAWVVALSLLIFQAPFLDLGTYLMNVPEQTEPLVRTYFETRIWAAPAYFSLITLMGWFFGMQNAWYPLLMTIVIAATNVLASFYLVHVLEWGVYGVALGTVIAQYTGLTFGIILFLWTSSYRQLLKRLALKTSFALRQWGHFLRVNSDIFLRTLCLSFTFAFFYRQSSDQGEYILAVNTVLLQFLNWMSFGIDGFAYAAESLVGKYKGAADKEKWNKALRLCFIWGMGLAGLYTLVYGIWGEDLLYVFSDKPEVIAEGKDYLFWFCLLPLLATPSYIWDGVFVGLTASKAMRNSMFMALVFFLAVYFIMDNYWQNHALWLALLVFLFMRGVIQTLMYKRGLTTT